MVKPEKQHLYSMASTAAYQKLVKYLNTAQQSSLYEKNTADCSPTFSNSSSYTDDSDDSNFTSPTTPGSPPAWSHKVNTIYKRKEGERGELREPPDLGTFGDWLRWDGPEDPQAEMNSLRRTQEQEESVVFIEDPVSFSPLFQSRQLNATGAVQREILYSQPPSWSYPVARGPQQQQQTQIPILNTILTPQEEMRLRDIAMPPAKPPTRSYSTPSLEYPASPSTAAQAHATLVLPHTKPTRPNVNTSSVLSFQRKRKSKLGSPFSDNQLEADSEGSEESANAPMKSSATAGKGKKTSHNVIEKRYRNNLNDKIAELRDSVPSLRVMSKHVEDEDDEMDRMDEDLQGLTPAHKLNKATILSKATEYIAHLEKRNAYLIRENADLKSRVDAFEILVTSRPQQQPQQHHQQQQQHQQHQQQGGAEYQIQRQDYQRGYEDGQRVFRQAGGNSGGLGQSSGWAPRG